MGSVLSLFSRVRRKGHARGVMQKAVNYADENGLTLMLVAQRYGSTTGLNDQQLVEFYKQFGFKVRHTPDNPLPVIMERPLKGNLETLS